MVKKLTFEALDFFILRTPLLPADLFQKQLNSSEGSFLERLSELAQNHLIREAIAVASPSLLDSLSNLSPDSPPRKQNQAARAFLRYLIRMSTRPTPFGLFSGVAYGVYGDHYNFCLQKADGYKKRTRPDMEWLLNIIACLETDNKLFSQLFVLENTMAYKAGARTYLPYLTHCRHLQKNSDSSQMKSTSVRTTKAVLQALAFAKTPVTCEELITKLQNEYPDTSHEQINQFVRQLFQQELLISELRPPLVDMDPISYVLEKLQKIEGVDELKSQLKEIGELIQEYDRHPLGQGEELYRSLTGKMRAVVDSKNLLQVDLNVKADRLILPYSVKEEVEQVAEVLWRVSNDSFGLPHMIQYRNDFMEQYGTDREVPLLELLDEDIGLGTPATYKYPRSWRNKEHSDFPFQQRKKHLLSQWLMEVLLEGEQELVLDDNKVAELTGEEMDTCYAPRSFELFFSLVTPSKEAMEAGDYRLLTGMASGSYGAGKSIGRFADFMDQALIKQLKQVDTLESESCPDIVFAELVFLPVDGRAANVLLTVNNRQYEIVMGTTSSKDSEHTIPLTDLVVGMDQAGFYLRSLKLGKEVIITVNHMFNTNQTPNVYRFLRELAQERQRNIEVFGWGELDSLPFLPRVRYNRCVLSPARWVLTQELSPFQSNMKKEDWIKAFQIYRKKWHVPRYVYLTQLDNRLLLDLDQKEYLNEIYQEYLKLTIGNGILLTEMGHSFDELPLSEEESNKRQYFTEFVFPVIKSKTANKREGVKGRSNKIIQYTNRLKLPGCEWLYLKWYGVQERMEEFIGKQMLDFCQRAEQEKWVDSSFFMRYADPKPHLRLRFLGNSKKLQNEFLPNLHNFANSLLQEGMLSRIVIDTYDPEVERYGGSELIQLAEQWFCMDSNIVMNWIRMEQLGQLTMEKDMLAVLSVINIMEQFGLSFDLQYTFLNHMVNYKEYLDLFRKQYSLYTQLGDARNEFYNLANHPAGRILLPAFHMRGNILHNYGVQAEVREQSGTLSVSRQDLIHSIIHLHLNRLYGIDRKDENRVLTLARHTLHSLEYIRRRST